MATATHQPNSFRSGLGLYGVFERQKSHYEFLSKIAELEKEIQELKKSIGKLDASIRNETKEIGELKNILGNEIIRDVQEGIKKLKSELVEEKRRVKSVADVYSVIVRDIFIIPLEKQYNTFIKCRKYSDEKAFTDLVDLTGKLREIVNDLGLQPGVTGEDKLGKIDPREKLLEAKRIGEMLLLEHDAIVLSLRRLEEYRPGECGRLEESYKRLTRIISQLARLAENIEKES